ncbi:hypothetical protein B9Z55_010997 [Caenorhabditis nigoni]|uniref:Homeobox domain-containing protein n=1 Tax=Caenorhabditis nigoni TaxID=1611254 RepID=A0A2G5UIT5_9PELO|nr:hypothetical protein B9Z55_010997 [Caenorhabditis nigoni]
MVNRIVRKSRKDAASTERASSGADLKRRRLSKSSGSESEDNVQIVKRGRGRPRKDATGTQGALSGINVKRNKPSSFSESESDEDVQKERPIRRAVRCVNYDETLYDFDESPIREKAEKRSMDKPKQRVDSKEDASSSSETESDSEPDERKSQGVRRAQGKRIQRFTDEQTKILLAVFHETEFPSDEQKQKLAEETNRTIRQIDRWFHNKKQSIKNPRPVKRYVKKFTLEQKQKMNEVFAASRNPEQEKIAALVAELELTTKQVKAYFRNQRFNNPIPGEISRVVSEEQAKHGIVDGEPPRRERYSEKRNRFMRERNAKKRKQFEDAMEKCFEERQFLEEPDEALELASGGSWKTISDWLDKKRFETLKSFLKKEILVMPKEMARFESLSEKYCLDSTTHPDFILYIEMKENVNGDSLAVYLTERSFVLEILEQNRTEEVHAEDVKGEEEKDLEDPKDEEYSNEMELDLQMNVHEDVDFQEENEMESGKNGNGSDTPGEASVNEELQGQMEKTVRENSPPDIKDIPLLRSSREENRRPPIVNHIKNEFYDFPTETKNVPRFVRAPGNQERIQEPIENDEENEVHLMVYDVIDLDMPDEIAAHGPVSIQRVQASYDDLGPFLGDIIGLEEIGFARGMEIAECKRRLNYLQDLKLPFNCCLQYRKWTKTQIMEFLCQLFTTGTTKKLTKKITTGSKLSMFQNDGHFEKLNENGQFINENQFSIIRQQIEKLNRFQ